MRKGFVIVCCLAVGACAPIATNTALSSGNRVELERRAEIRMQLATAYYSEGQYATALSELDQALQIGERKADVLGLRGLVFMQLGDPETASKNLQQALQIEPDNPNLLNNMGWFLCETGQTERALPLFDRALASKAYQSPVKAMMNAGRCSMKLGRRSQAEDYFLRALQADPEQMGAHSSLGKLAFEAHDLKRAKRHLLTVISSGRAIPEDFSIAMAIERQLGDKLGEESIARQWRKRFPDALVSGKSSLGLVDE
jgi:type IV pilus assembly protein PilF